MSAEDRKYPPSELEVLESGAREVVEPNGLRLMLKPVPGDDREHVLDPRVYARAHAKLAAGPAPAGPVDVIAWRSAPNKETHVVRGAGVAKKTIVMNFGDRGIPLHVFTPEGHESGSAALVFIHGGGFMVGNIGQYENSTGPMRTGSSSWPSCIRSSTAALFRRNGPMTSMRS